MSVLPYLLSLAAVVAVVRFATVRARADEIVVRLEPKSIDTDRMISAIKGAENWDGRTAGASGEWGPMQMTPIIYRQFSSDEPGYIKFLISECKQLKRTPTPWLIGFLHNAGYPAVRDHAALASKLEFAQRVENLYNDATL